MSRAHGCTGYEAKNADLNSLDLCIQSYVRTCTMIMLIGAEAEVGKENLGGLNPFKQFKERNHFDFHFAGNQIPFEYFLLFVFHLAKRS